MTGWEITRKDLQLLRRDRRALIVLIVLPMAFICILGLTTGRLLGWKKNNQLLSLCVVNSDDSQLSNRLAGNLADIDGIRLIAVDTVDQATALLEDGDASAIVEIGTEFQSRARSLSPSAFFDSETRQLQLGLSELDITVTSRPAMAMVRSVVDQLVLLSAIRVVLPDVAERLKIIPSINHALQNVEQEAKNDKSSKSKLTTELADDSSNESNTGNQVYQTIVPAYTVMFAFFLVNIMARSFIAERELGTLKRLHMAPLSEFQIVVGKTLPFLMISLVQCGALFLFGRLLFGMSWGTQPWLLLPVMITTSLSATGLGLLVATMVRTDSQVSAYANFLVITLAGISGCFMPREWLPEGMQTISLATPHAWALLAYDHVLIASTPDLRIVAKTCGALTGFAVLFLGLGVWRFRSRGVS
jgi:ABC-2 type transport system permease protein